LTFNLMSKSLALSPNPGSPHTRPPYGNTIHDPMALDYVHVNYAELYLHPSPSIPIPHDPKLLPNTTKF
jgi:hypothetical protein